MAGVGHGWGRTRAAVNMASVGTAGVDMAGGGPGSGGTWLGAGMASGRGVASEWWVGTAAPAARRGPANSRTDCAARFRKRPTVLSLPRRGVVEFAIGLLAGPRPFVTVSDGGSHPEPSWVRMCWPGRASSSETIHAKAGRGSRSFGDGPSRIRKGLFRARRDWHEPSSGRARMRRRRKLAEAPDKGFGGRSPKPKQSLQQRASPRADVTKPTTSATRGFPPRLRLVVFSAS